MFGNSMSIIVPLFIVFLIILGFGIYRFACILRARQDAADEVILERRLKDSRRRR